MFGVLCFSINFAEIEIKPLFFPFILSPQFLNDFFLFWSYNFLSTIYIQPPSNAKQQLIEQIGEKTLAVFNELYRRNESLFLLSYNPSCVNYHVQLSSNNKFTILIVTEFLFAKYLYLDEITQDMIDYWLTKYSRSFLDYPRSYLVFVIDNCTQRIEWTNKNSPLPQNICKEVNEKFEEVISSSFQDAERFPNISTTIFVNYM